MYGCVSGCHTLDFHLTSCSLELMLDLVALHCRFGVLVHEDHREGPPTCENVGESQALEKLWDSTETSLCQPRNSLSSGCWWSHFCPPLLDQHSPNILAQVSHTQVQAEIHQDHPGMPHIRLWVSALKLGNSSFPCPVRTVWGGGGYLHGQWRITGCCFAVHCH